ncbi:MAG: glucosamine-6-phosphate deaminase [Candidatus Sumerlaeia bacterium]|nr:glucosamine-6-phosphate deaminase [Candidatus Sumerlaeia bacterium]
MKKQLAAEEGDAAAPVADGAEEPPPPASRVEQWFLKQSGRQMLYPPVEHLPVIEVPNFPALGRLTALRFLEWAMENPEGVASLPTGKTPEYFIKWVKYYLQRWDDPAVQNEWAEIGLPRDKKPDLRGLHFVQIDEFYPIEPAQHNSFHYYVMKHYIKGFGLDPRRALLIDPTAIGIPAGHTLDTIFPDGRVDLSLRSRNPVNRHEELQRDVILAVDQFCSDYEARIRAMGGLGFFLGGIGPDGHIAFNTRGSNHFSPTRLTMTNYETEAAAAGDLGGIETARGRPVITLGLATITYNPNAVVIIFAAGEAKARVVADAVQNPKNILFPATALQGMPNARLYLTTGATVYLTERRFEDICKAESLSDETIERAVIDYALARKLRLDQFRRGEEKNDRFLHHIVQRTGRALPDLAAWTRERILERIERGRDDLQDQVILHTAPHHDDIMLGYMPYVMHLVRRASNRNYFYILTSGFTAVTNTFLAGLLKDLLDFLDRNEFRADRLAGDLEPDNKSARAAEVYSYLDGIAARDPQMKRRAQARRTLINMIVVYEDEDFDNLKQRIIENLNYLKTLYPGKKDIPNIQRLKGMQREFEEELVWAYAGVYPDQVIHGRLGFYTGDLFAEQPTHERDVRPVLELLQALRPTVVSVAFDPEGAGPDTHYKVLQVLHEALLRYQKKTGQAPAVWGYRNIWYRFHPAEANIYVPVSNNLLAVVEHSFMNCFNSQRDASFPSHEYDGPFCHLAQNIWVGQFRMIQTCLGERFFIDNPSPRLRATRGLVFLKAMSLDEFSGKARRLAEVTEAGVR